MLLSFRRARRKERSIPQFSPSSEVKSSPAGVISERDIAPARCRSVRVVAPDRLIEDVSALLGLVLGEAHRRRDAEHISVETPFADEQSVASRLLENPTRDLGASLAAP